MANRKLTSVPIETVDVGDVVSVSWKDRDVTRIARGLVAVVRRYGHTRVLESEEGGEIVRFSLAKPRAVTVLDIERYVPMQPGLFKLEGETL